MEPDDVERELTLVAGLLELARPTAREVEFRLSEREAKRSAPLGAASAARERTQVQREIERDRAVATRKLLSIARHWKQRITEGGGTPSSGYVLSPGQCEARFEHLLRLDPPLTRDAAGEVLSAELAKMRAAALELDAFVAWAGQWVLLASSPAAELDSLLGNRPGKGRVPGDSDEDFDIAIAVARYLAAASQSGDPDDAPHGTLDRAFKAVSQGWSGRIVNPDRVRTIYQAYNRAAKAAVKMETADGAARAAVEMKTAEK